MVSNFYIGKVVIITGSSRGIGKEIATQLAQKGAFVVLNGRNKERLQKTENDLRNIQVNTMSVCCDVSTIEGCKLLVDSTLKQFKKIDILINNAGVSMRGEMAELNPDVFKRVIDCNLLGSAYTSIACLKHLRKTEGSIVFISSLAGIRGLPSLSAYCSSKMALRAMAESIRIEEKKNNIHVGLILVGVTEIEADKESINSDGSVIKLNSRDRNKVDSLQNVAKEVIKNIKNRKFITVLTRLGFINYYMQSFFPSLVEKIIERNIEKFNKSNK